MPSALMPANPGELQQNGPAGNGEGQQNQPDPAAVLTSGSTNSPCPVLQLPKGLGWTELGKWGEAGGKPEGLGPDVERHQELPWRAWGTTGSGASPAGQGAGCWGLVNGVLGAVKLLSHRGRKRPLGHTRSLVTGLAAAGSAAVSRGTGLPASEPGQPHSAQG